jgi:glyoxylase-like metal-dependent hydrolase (beta-lactamase superfamily II)
VFVLRCKGTGDAVIVDAANEHELLLEVAKATGVRRVLTTHGHWDHIQAVPQLRDAGYSVGVTAEDAAMLPSYDEVIEDDSVIQVGNVRLHTIHTPGHTPDRCASSSRGHRCSSRATRCFRAGPAPRSSRAAALDHHRVDRPQALTLPVETLVLPGHGDDTTIGTERPHLQEWIDRGCENRLGDLPLIQQAAVVRTLAADTHEGEPVMDLGPAELIIILLIVLLVFGGTKLLEARTLARASPEGIQDRPQEGAQMDEADDKPVTKAVEKPSDTPTS